MGTLSEIATFSNDENDLNVSNKLTKVSEVNYNSVLGDNSLEKDKTNINGITAPQDVDNSKNLKNSIIFEEESLNESVDTSEMDDNSKPSEVGEPKEVASNNLESPELPSQSNIIEENMETAVSFTKRKHKRLQIVDSDSESEELIKTVGVTETILDGSQSQDRASPTEKTMESIVSSTKRKPRRIAIADSDSEDEEQTTVTPHDKSFNDESAPVYNVTKSGELVAETTEFAIQKSRLSALCDSESSDEDYDRRMEEYDRSSNLGENDTDEKKTKPKNYKKDKKTEEEEKKMTGKQALEQRREILSESHRRVREKQVSLPYHRPKPRTLKEFLQKRPKFADALPGHISKAPPSIAIKMTNEQLEIISKKLEEREKVVVEEFYKSESESEEEHEENKPNKGEESKSEGNSSEGGKEKKGDDSAETQDGAVKESDDVQSSEDNKDINDEKMDTSTNIEAETDSNVNSANSESASENAQNNVNISDSEMKNTSKNVLQEIIFNLSEEMDVDDLPIENSKPKSTDEQKLESLLNQLNFPSVNDISTESTGNTQPDCTSTSESNSVAEEEEVCNEPQEQEVKLSALELIKQKFANIKPRLSGGPDQEIDLEEGVTKPSPVSQLMERFMKHASKKTPSKSKVQLSITSVLSGGEIHKETVAMSIESEDKPVVLAEKPGAKLQRLKCELQIQMAQRRSELWHQKVQPNSEPKDDESVYDGETSECGADDILDNDEEEELTDPESSEEEDNVAEKPEKPKKKSAFIDEEAEVDDEENEEDEELREASEFGGDEEEESQHVNTEGDEETQDTQTKKKALKRIVRAFEDSDDENSRHSTESSREDRAILENIERNLDSRGSWDDDDVLPPAQRVTNHTPRRELTQSKPDLSFLTPIGHLTGLQGHNSASKFLHDSPIISPFQLPPEPSPLKTQRSVGPQKNLFADSEDVPDSQTNVEELADLCSGKFPSQTQGEKKLPTLTPDTDPSQVNTQDLMELCSGDFATQASKESNKDSNSSANNVKIDYINSEIGSSEIKTLGSENEDRLISQLLDEEEMLLFKKKFETPLKDKVRLDSSSETHVGRVLYDSSDEEGEADSTTKKKRKAKVVDSDSDEEVECNQDEEIDLHDMDSDDEMEAGERKVEYDSEENEIEVDKEGKPKEKLKMKDFFENEAELSESEWGSADEDEKDLDEFEVEQGDADVFDQNKLKKDLEKIHMRQVLDEDNREVKILQELLLEDGDLHGTGRQRQFRWKNIETAGNEIEEKKDDQEIYLEEDESEEQWRRKRYERELFLKKQQEKTQHLEDDDDASVLATSQVLKWGQKAIIKNSATQNNTPIQQPKVVPSSPEAKLPITLKHKRGSFLTRNDKVLEKLAQISSKVADTGTVVGAPKNSRNFVFQTVSSNSLGSETAILKFDKKRKATDGTPNVIKKLRLSNNFSPVVKRTSKTKTNAKKLFSVS